MGVVTFFFGIATYFALISLSHGWHEHLISRSGCYGDITKLSPTGASEATAKGSGLPYAGVKASDALASYDKQEIKKRLSEYSQTAILSCMDPALIAALASRESDAGLLLYKTNGWGDYRQGKYHAYGILQCDVFTSGLNCTKYEWYSAEHMEMMIQQGFLPKLKCVVAKMPTWTAEQQLQGAVAAYNFGCSNVRSWANLDKGTTGNDYSNDVIARAQWIKQNIQF